MKSRTPLVAILTALAIAVPPAARVAAAKGGGVRGGAVVGLLACAGAAAVGLEPEALAACGSVTKLIGRVAAGAVWGFLVHAHKEGHLQGQGLQVPRAANTTFSGSTASASGAAGNGGQQR